MTECQDCLSKDVAWRQGKNGNYYLIDTRRPHFCPKRKKGAKPPGGDLPSTIPRGNPMAVEVVAGLVGLGYKDADAKRYVAGAGDAPDVHSLTLAALAVKNAEMLKRKEEE